MPPLGTTGYQFSDEQDVFLLRIIMKVKGHVAPPGTKYRLFSRIHRIYCDNSLSDPMQDNCLPTARKLFWRFVVLLRTYGYQDSKNPHKSACSNVQRQKFSILESIVSDRQQAGIDKENDIREAIQTPTSPLPPPPPLPTPTCKPAAQEHQDRHPSNDQNDSDDVQYEPYEDDSHSNAPKHQQARQEKQATQPNHMAKRRRLDDSDGRAASSIIRRKVGELANTTRAAPNPQRSTPRRSTGTTHHCPPASTPRRSPVTTLGTAPAGSHVQPRRASYSAITAVAPPPALPATFNGTVTPPLQPLRERSRSRPRWRAISEATRRLIADQVSALPRAASLPSGQALPPLNNREHTRNRTAERTRRPPSDAGTRNEATVAMPTEGDTEVGGANGPVVENLDTIMRQLRASGRGTADQLIDIIKRCIEMDKQRQIMEDREKERTAKHRRVLDHLLIYLAQRVQ